MSRQEGLSLPETLIATLLLSVSLLGLLQYYQSLSQGFIRQWHVRQAWSEAHDQLESFAVTGKGKVLQKNGWQIQITDIKATESCQRVSISVETPLRYTSQLSRWICRPGAD